MNRFELTLFVGPSAQTISLPEYLAGRRQGSIHWLPDLENATLHLTINNQEYIAPHWSLGALRQMAPQLLPVRHRLAQGKTALLRAGIDDNEFGTYFLMEPREGNVYISMLYLQEAPYKYRYPIPEGSPQVQELYDYVLTHREALLAESAMHHNTFQNIAYPLPDLLQALEREYAVAEAFREEYGQW